MQTWKSSEAQSRFGPSTHGSAGSLKTAVTVAALVLLTGCSPDGDRRDAIREKPAAVRLWGDAVRIQEILLEPDALVRAETLASELRSLAPLALEDVLSAYDTVLLDIGDFELKLLAEWWAGFDPEAAYAWSHEDWRARHPAIFQAVLRAWARIDPEAALRVAEQESSFSIRRPAVGAVLIGWEEGGRPGVFEYVESLPPGHDRQRYLAFVARRKVLRDGVDAAIRWAESQPDEPGLFKLNLFRRVASTAAQVEPLRAAAWAEAQLGGPFGDQLPQRVGTRWVTHEPEAAMEWFQKLPAGFDREKGLQETYRVWLRLDKAAAHAWMEGREHAAWLDPARALYAMSLYKEPGANPRIAIDQALSIVDEARRWSTVGRIWRVWYARDAESAEAWFLARQSEMPSFYRARIPMLPKGIRKAAGLDLPSFLEEGGARGSHDGQAISDDDSSESNENHESGKEEAG